MVDRAQLHDPVVIAEQRGGRADAVVLPPVRQTPGRDRPTVMIAKQIMRQKLVRTLGGAARGKIAVRGEKAKAEAAKKLGVLIFTQN